MSTRSHQLSTNCFHVFPHRVPHPRFVSVGLGLRCGVTNAFVFFRAQC
jgi:hypothetical protein